MKTIAILFAVLFSLQLQAQSSCRCTCEPGSNSLCASTIDLDNPCPSLCQKAPGSPFVGATACPVVKVYNPRKGEYEWDVQCPPESIQILF